MDQQTLTDLELQFCRMLHVYHVEGALDPIGLWASLFDPEGKLTLDERATGYAEMVERNDIRLEIHAQKRVLDTIGATRLQLVAELEEARQKALGEPDGACIALQATLEKAKLLELTHEEPRVLSIGEFLAAPVNKPLLLN